MWEEFFEVYWVGVLESQQSSMRQGQKVLTEVSGSLVYAGVYNIYRPVRLVWSAPDFENAPSQPDIPSVRVEKRQATP